MKSTSIPNGSVTSPDPAPRILATLREAARATGADFDRIVNPAAMAGTQ
jgi:hypothetical protein